MTCLTCYWGFISYKQLLIVSEEAYTHNTQTYRQLLKSDFKKPGACQPAARTWFNKYFKHFVSKIVYLRFTVMRLILNINF